MSVTISVVKIEKAHVTDTMKESTPHVLEAQRYESLGLVTVNFQQIFLNATNVMKKLYQRSCWRCMSLAHRHEKCLVLLRNFAEKPSPSPLYPPERKNWMRRWLAWQFAPFDKAYLYLMTDVVYIQVRENHRVISKSCHIAIGFSKKGDREVLGFLIQERESETTWTNFFEYVKQRQLTGLQRIISDAHSGLIQAIRKNFRGVAWLRCQVYFL